MLCIVQLNDSLEWVVMIQDFNFVIQIDIKILIFQFNIVITWDVVFNVVFGIYFKKIDIEIFLFLRNVFMVMVLKNENII